MDQKKIAFLFPGQGAQYVGMGKDLCSYQVAKETFEEADDLLKEKMSEIIFHGPLDLLTETKNSQLGIFIVSVAIFHVLQQQMPKIKPFLCAGLSLGEYTALYAAGKLSFKDTLLLIQKRASFMDEACRTARGGMSAVLGLDTARIEKALKESGLHDSVWVANCNSPGQVVVSGVLEKVRSAEIPLKAAGAKRVIPLQVHGAFHSPLMLPAQEKLEPFIRSTVFRETGVSLVMNVPGDFAAFSEMQDFLVQQVTSSVRWDRGILAMQQKQVDLYLEMGCGKTLSALTRKILPAAAVFSLEKSSDFDELSKRYNA